MTSDHFFKSVIEPDKVAPVVLYPEDGGGKFSVLFPESEDLLPYRVEAGALAGLYTRSGRVQAAGCGGAGGAGPGAGRGKHGRTRAETSEMRKHSVWVSHDGTYRQHSNMQLNTANNDMSILTVQ